MILREKDRLALVDIFSTLFIPVEVWAYGSRVNGSAHDGSDLDLVIRDKELKGLPIEIYTHLVETIKNSNIPILVELRDWNHLPKNFHDQIVLQYEVLFDSEWNSSSSSRPL